jgi:hypothetical protein
MARKPIPENIEVHVLLACARRCALCFGLGGDLSRKKGQIAHIDHDASNPAEDNLVYLCFDHHDEYDSTTSQAKGITLAELREYKKRLLSAITAGEHNRQAADRDPADTRRQAIQGHDERVFKEANAILEEGCLRSFLDQLTTDDSYRMSEARTLDRFQLFFAETGSQFINEELSVHQRDLSAALDNLLRFLAIHFFVYPKDQTYEDTRFCLYPEMNIDRGGPGTTETMKHYSTHQKQLDTLVAKVRKTYEAYRSLIKAKLLL